MITTIYSDPDFLEHHGVKGMKWGVRRYQNYDGTRVRNAPHTQIDRNKAQKEFEAHNNNYKGKSWADESARVNVKFPGEETFTELYRYQDHFFETDKAERIGYHVIYDMLNKTAVGEKTFVKLTKDGLGETELRTEKLTEADYKKAEENLSKYVVTKNTGNSNRKKSVYKAKRELDESLKKRNDAVGKFWSDVERDPKVRHDPLRNMELSSNSKKEAKARKLLEKEFSKLQYDDMDKDMIAIGEKYAINRR